MRLKLEALTLAELALMDNGLVNQLFRVHALRAARDAADRPGDKNARSVTLQMKIKPKLNAKGEIAHVDVEIECKSKLPDHRTATYQMKADPDHGLLYNPGAPDALHQLTFEDIDIEADSPADAE